MNDFKIKLFKFMLSIKKKNRNKINIKAKSLFDFIFFSVLKEFDVTGLKILKIYVHTYIVQYKQLQNMCVVLVIQIDSSESEFRYLLHNLIFY